MTNRIHRYSILAGLLWISVAKTAGADGNDCSTLRAVLDPSPPLDVQPVIPPTDELARAEALFLGELGGADPQALASGWAELGFVRTASDKTACVVLHEHPDHRSGRGVFLLCPDVTDGRILQMPHRFKDQYTGDIGLQLTCEHRWLAAAWNSVARTQPLPDGTPADLAHLPYSYFNALIRAVALSGRATRVIEIHGFAQANRITEAGRHAHVIVGAGTYSPPPALDNAAECLKKRVHPETLRFPDEVSELGALTNVQGQIARSLGLDFLHVELSRSLRLSLLDGRSLRNGLADCLADH